MKTGARFPNIKKHLFFVFNKYLFIINLYFSIYEGDIETNCSCTKSCKSNVFSAFVQNRRIYRPPIPEYYTQVYVYYTTKLITVSK